MRLCLFCLLWREEKQEACMAAEQTVRRLLLQRFPTAPQRKLMAAFLDREGARVADVAGRRPAREAALKSAEEAKKKAQVGVLALCLFVHPLLGALSRGRGLQKDGEAEDQVQKQQSSKIEDQRT